MLDWALAFTVITGAVVYLRAAAELPALMLGDEVGPRTFPFMIGIGLLIAGAMLAIETWRRHPTAPAPGTARPRAVLLGVLAWTILYYAAFEPVGYILSTAVYAAALLFYFNRAGRFWNLAYAAGFTGAAYLVFARFLGVALPPGLWAA